jgi:hypothetical protein
VLISSSREPQGMASETFSCPEGEIEGQVADCSGTNGRSESSM